MIRKLFLNSSTLEFRLNLIFAEIQLKPFFFKGNSSLCGPTMYNDGRQMLQFCAPCSVKTEKGHTHTNPPNHPHTQRERDWLTHTHTHRERDLPTQMTEIKVKSVLLCKLVSQCCGVKGSYQSSFVRFLKWTREKKAQLNWPLLFKQCLHCSLLYHMDVYKAFCIVVYLFNPGLYSVCHSLSPQAKSTM
jgi:hypothetical protein